ncbi:MAG: hypothetical protein H3C47_08270, partial [Candidatus Cloacimonetes bacterium]|nr:hypothetical protein [Candidatus Cloacimonadota bacterium]
MRLLQFLSLCLWFCVINRSFGLGETRLFQFRDPLKSASSPDRITAFNAVNRVQKTIRPGWELRMFVEEGVWNTSTPTGLDPEGSISQNNRLAVLDQFADTMRQIILTMENLATSFKVPANASLDGINFVFLDIQDGFSSDPSQDERKGSYFAARFDPLDQEAASGLNRSNLIYVDLNPGTLGRELVFGVNRKKTWQDAVRSLGKLILYQQNTNKEAWIQEGYAQYILYRLLKQRPFPQGQELILNVPAEPVSEVSLFLADPVSVYAGYITDSDLMDRVFFEKTPRDLLDNVRNSQLRGFSYLFFTYLFHKMGGNFETTNTPGDEFFRSLAQDSRTGVEALKALILNKGSSLGTILEDFYLSLVFRTQEQ